MTKISNPFAFVLDYLHPKEVSIKPMFGCFNVYLNNKFIFFLRARKDRTELIEYGWQHLPDDYDSLQVELPSIHQDKKIVEDKKSNKKNWLLLSAHDKDFELLVRKACELVLNNDKRIGKITKGSLKTK